MMINKIIKNQTIIIKLDVDAHIFTKLQKISNLGFSVIEINCVDPIILKKSLSMFPDLCIGAGNIINVQQLEDCYQAGVSFVTSPGFLPEIAQTASVYSINYLPGIATISEAMHALTFGCTEVKPFPANLTFCTLLNKYLPHLHQFPAEIEWEEVEHFLNLPSVAAVSIINPEIKQLQALSTAICT